MAHVNPHLVLRSSSFRRVERISAGKRRPKKEAKSNTAKPSDHEVVAFLNSVGLQQHYPRIKKLGAVHSLRWLAMQYIGKPWSLFTQVAPADAVFRC